MMAAQMLRFGIQPMIIDAKRGPDRKSKAIAVHARSLELFRQIGLADKLLARGLHCYVARVKGRKYMLGKVDFSQIKASGTAFPFIHLVGQDNTEKILIDRLTKETCPVIWETRLISLRQDDKKAIVELIHNDTIQKWMCKWVIGADGADSDVRKLLGIPFEGKKYRGRFFFADVQVKGAQNHNIHFFLPKKSFLGVLPFSIKGRYRLVGLLPDEWSEKQDIQYADIKATIDKAFGFELPVSQCSWISTFILQRRLAEQFMRQRSFLIGDAAHVHSPVGGQGMNTGLQDAANLAWKLAGVVSGRMKPQVLQTYQQERKPVAEQAIRLSDRVFSLTIGMGSWLYPVRDFLLAKGLNYMGKTPQRLGNMFSKMAQLSINYRQTALAVHHATNRKIRAGDRVPFMHVYDEKAKIETDLHRWCEKAGFILLLLGTISPHHLRIFAQWVRQKYPREMHLYYLPYSPRNHQVFDAFEVKPQGTKIVLIRPDMYIGYINDMVNVSLIDTYMEEVMGWNFFRHLPEKP